MTMLTRPRAWTALALIASLTAMLSTGPASAGTLPPLLKIKSGTANFCLAPAAKTALDTAGIGMSAGAPAQLLSTAPSRAPPPMSTRARSPSASPTAAFRSTAPSPSPAPPTKPPSPSAT